MDKDRIIETLRRHQPELNDAGIVHLRLHGSQARGDGSALSDADLIADLDSAKRFTILRIVGIQNRISDLLGLPVDLSASHTLKPRVRDGAERNSILVF